MAPTRIYLVCFIAIAHVSIADTFCPAAGDIVVAYGAANVVKQGWSITGSGGVATKAAFNLLGGSVEYDIDVTKTHPGVNANVYTIAPSNINPISGFTQDVYCDGARTGSTWCVEDDFIESNGNCGGSSALHTREGPGNDGCTAWGCKIEYHYNGKTSFHMKIEYGADGRSTMTRDGAVLGATTPTPQAQDLATIVQQYQSRGAVIYSSHWTGWVPVADCGQTPGDLGTSSMSISNMKITGTVVQGPRPATCDGESAPANPITTPTSAAISPSTPVGTAATNAPNATPAPSQAPTQAAAPAGTPAAAPSPNSSTAKHVVALESIGPDCAGGLAQGGAVAQVSMRITDATGNPAKEETGLPFAMVTFNSPVSIQQTWNVGSPASQGSVLTFKLQNEQPNVGGIFRFEKIDCVGGKLNPAITSQVVFVYP